MDAHAQTKSTNGWDMCWKVGWVTLGLGTCFLLFPQAESATPLFRLSTPQFLVVPCCRRNPAACRPGLPCGQRRRPPAVIRPGHPRLRSRPPPGGAAEGDGAWASFYGTPPPPRSAIHPWEDAHGCMLPSFLRREEFQQLQVAF